MKRTAITAAILACAAILLSSCGAMNQSAASNDSKAPAQEQNTQVVDEMASYSNIFDYMEGRVAGVSVDYVYGKRCFIIRNAMTLDMEPAPALVLLDGVEVSDPEMINPNDIESVQVFKDASECAIYGERGMYGVISITTKH